jgi:hypothetical protein
MSEISRRDVLRQLALIVAASGVVDRAGAQEVHHMAAQAMAAAGGTYEPTGLTRHEYATVARLADLVIPVENGAPGAVQADVPQWIDMLVGVNDQLKGIYNKGVAWIDSAMAKGAAADFLSATPAQQTALLDQIAFKKNQSPDLAPGIEFFTWVRRMTVDGFYTSHVGMRDIYKGNTPQLTFTVPQDAIDYALKRSGL